jgi:hypothetical protein
MNFADVFFWLLIVAGTYLALLAYWLAAMALFRSTVERARLAYAVRPVASVGVGLAVLLPILLLGVGLVRATNGPSKLLVLMVLMVPLVFALVGSAGLADRIGAGLPSPEDTARPWRRVLRGGAVLGLLFIVPVLGWFALFPLTLASGLGALILSRRLLPPSAATERHSPIASSIGG